LEKNFKNIININIFKFFSDKILLNMKKPIRMCISCRERFEQSELIRLKCQDKKIIPYDKSGRSFYICANCIQQEKKTNKNLISICKNRDDYYLQLKGILKI
jgi:predicted RNA-binding protein YlxR (DUF448 family)